MKKYYFILLGLMGILLFSSCSKNIYFTRNMRMNLNKNKLSVDKVQFYNSKKIELLRYISSAETKIARGEIRYENGRYSEEIIIPKNTPGIVVSEGKKFLNVAFEDGKNRNLKFVLNDKNQYQISADNWKQNYGRVVYDTLIYYIEPKSDKARLTVKKDNIYNFRANKRVVKGRVVKGRSINNTRK